MEGGRATCTVPLLWAPPCIHGPASCVRGGHGINHLGRHQRDDLARAAPRQADAGPAVAVVVYDPRCAERLRLDANDVARRPEPDLVLEDPRVANARLDRRAALEDRLGVLAARLGVPVVLLGDAAENQPLAVREQARPRRTDG